VAALGIRIWPEKWHKETFLKPPQDFLTWENINNTHEELQTP
jgi:hypothetical protein